MAASRFVEVSNKAKLSEIKMNLYQKNTKKTCAKILKQLFAEGEGIVQAMFLIDNICLARYLHPWVDRTRLPNQLRR
jgi:hypothetical protein